VAKGQKSFPLGVPAFFSREGIGKTIWALLGLPSWKLTYPTWGKGKSSSNMPYQGDMLIPWRVNVQSTFAGLYTSFKNTLT